MFNNLLKIRSKLSNIKRYRLEVSLAICALFAFAIIIKWFNDMYSIIFTYKNIILINSIILCTYIALKIVFVVIKAPIIDTFFKNNAHFKLSAVTTLGLVNSFIIALFYTSSSNLILFLFIYEIFLFIRTIVLLSYLFKLNVTLSYKKSSKRKKYEDDIMTATKHIDILLTQYRHEKEQGMINPIRNNENMG